VIGSAEDELAEKIKKELKSAVQRIAPLLKIDLTFNSGLLSEVTSTFQRPARVRSFL